MVQRCETCVTYSPAQKKETLMPHDTPAYPWQKVGVDICQIISKSYLVIADYFSLYPEVITLPHSATSSAVENALKSVFSRHGTPEVVFTDNGPQFDSAEFVEFASDWEFSHETSSPYFPQSNGLAESAVKTAKALIKKAIHSKQDVYKALQAYRATAVIDGLSPAEILMGRRLRTTLPLHPTLLTKPWMSEVAEKKQEIQKQQKAYYDIAAKDLPVLSRGQMVKMRDMKTGRWNSDARVIQIVADRSYEVEGLDGGRYRRNRCHLKPIPDPYPNPARPEHKPEYTIPIPPAPASTSFASLPVQSEFQINRRSSRNRRPPDRWAPES